MLVLFNQVPSGCVMGECFLWIFLKNQFFSLILPIYSIKSKLKTTISYNHLFEQYLRKLSILEDSLAIFKASSLVFTGLQINVCDIPDSGTPFLEIFQSFRHPRPKFWTWFACYPDKLFTGPPSNHFKPKFWSGIPVTSKNFQKWGSGV